MSQIPKFIQNVPWYKEGEKEEMKDHSFSQSGKGFHDINYDSKRDNYDNLEIIYKDTKEVEELSSDDTDFELECQELNINKADLHNNNKQHKAEKLMRDRKDVPDYIKSFTTK